MTSTLRRIDDILAGAVASGAVPNVVVTVADDSGPVYEGAAGPRVAGGDEPVTADATFRIASMTKLVTSVAALQQAEHGALDLDAPVAAYLPEFADLPVLDGFDGDTPRLRAPATEATVRHLLTHTAGLGYWFWNADLARWETLTGTPNVLSGKLAALTAPLVADPGTRFEYGIASDWLGRVVEVVCGETLDEVFERDVFEPLGMRSTGFRMTPEQRATSVPVHLRRDGAWTPTRIDWSPEPEWESGGHGLYSTPRDFLSFQRMLLGGGELAGQRLLSAETVAAAFQPQIGDLRVPEVIRTAHPASSCDFEAGPGQTWGYGLMVNTVRRPGMRAVGSGGWSGIDNTHVWVDPVSRVTCAVYSQFLPFVTPESMAVYADVERAVYAG